jgi:hypothetical protein
MGCVNSTSDPDQSAKIFKKTGSSPINVVIASNTVTPNTSPSDVKPKKEFSSHKVMPINECPERAKSPSTTVRVLLPNAVSDDGEKIEKQLRTSESSASVKSIQPVALPPLHPVKYAKNLLQLTLKLQADKRDVTKISPGHKAPIPPNSPSQQPDPTSHVSIESEHVLRKSSSATSTLSLHQRCFSGSMVSVPE